MELKSERLLWLATDVVVCSRARLPITLQSINHSTIIRVRREKIAKDGYAIMEWSTCGRERSYHQKG